MHIFIHTTDTNENEQRYCHDMYTEHRTHFARDTGVQQRGMGRCVYPAGGGRGPCGAFPQRGAHMRHCADSVVSGLRTIVTGVYYTKFWSMGREVVIGSSRICTFSKEWVNGALRSSDRIY